MEKNEENEKKLLRELKKENEMIKRTIECLGFYAIFEAEKKEKEYLESKENNKNG